MEPNSKDPGEKPPVGEDWEGIPRHLADDDKEKEKDE